MAQSDSSPIIRLLYPYAELDSNENADCSFY